MVQNGVTEPSPCHKTIGGVWLCQGQSLKCLIFRKLGNCIIGAGSLVTKNTEIPDGCMAFGRPAKVVRELTEIEILTNQGTADWYVKEACKHKNN